MPKAIKVDDIVYAKWPGSTKYFKAIVTAIEDGQYDVKFESDDSNETVSRKHLMVCINFIFHFNLHLLNVFQMQKTTSLMIFFFHY